jgi:hypothetical protein
MWQRFKNWMGTAKAGAVINGVAAAIWGGLAFTSDNMIIRGLAVFNALLTAHLSGGKLTEHLTQPRLELKDSIIEGQHRLIVELIEGHRQVGHLDSSPELEDDQRLS